MCFSAGASFGAGVILSAVGVGCLKRAKHNHEKPFAAIPLLFAAQQISEGFVWLALTRPNYEPVEEPSVYFFLFFAQVIWPFWVPFSIAMLDKHEKFSAVRKWMLGFGVAVSSYLVYCLAKFPIEAVIDGHHIAYRQEYPSIRGWLVSPFYVAVILAPPFFSTIRSMRLLAVGSALSFAITFLMYKEYIISVWCFFAAMLSVIVMVIIKHSEEEQHHTPIRS